MEWSTGQTSIDGSWNWRGIAISSDGSKRTGAKNNGYLYVSSDYGLTWTEDTSVGSVQNWVGVSMSGDGAVQAAWGYSSVGIWTSTDSGSSWTYREPTGSTLSWHDVAISTDGVRMTAAPGTSQLAQLYISSDSGATWTATGPVKVWSKVAISSDGAIQTAASEDGTGSGVTGNLWRSTDYGVYDCAEHRTRVSSRLDARSPSPMLASRQDLDRMHWNHSGMGNCEPRRRRHHHVIGRGQASRRAVQREPLLLHRHWRDLDRGHRHHSVGRIFIVYT